MNIESSYDPSRQILTEESINVDSGSFPEIQDLYWGFRCHRLSAWAVSRELECIPHVLCYIFSWFHMILTFQPCIWIYDWLETYLYRMLWRIEEDIEEEPLHGYCNTFDFSFHNITFSCRRTPSFPGIFPEILRIFPEISGHPGGALTPIPIWYLYPHTHHPPSDRLFSKFHFWFIVMFFLPHPFI